MCGIFAYYSKDQRVKKDLLYSAAESLKHRGPDASAVWISKDATVGLAQTRLSIIDLNPIEMPICNEEKNIFIIANGEFYDHKNIRKELEKNGHKFKTHTDTEIALHLYEEKGIHCLKDLRGEFSFIIWDQQIRTLFAIRDRFGIKPLYYSLNDKGIYFSSEIPSLIKTKAVDPKWNLESLFTFTHCNLHSEQTFFNGIGQIPPGHFMRINNYGNRILQYWDADYPIEHETHNETEITKKVHDKLIESVSLRLNSDVPVACYLSGGLDSSTLLGMSSHIMGKPVDAFNISFDDEKVDENQIARRTAANIGSKLHTLAINDHDIVDNFEKAVVATCSPMANAAGVARYLLSQFVSSHGYKVVLSGEGADEIFLGYSYMVWEGLSDPRNIFKVENIEEYKKKLLSHLPVDRSNINNLPQQIKIIENILGYIPKWIETQGYFNASHRKLLSEEIINTYSSYNPYKQFINSFNIIEQMHGRDRVIQSVYLWIKSFFPNNMLNWIGDRAEMANSIEARLPFLDHVLFEEVKKIPTSMNIKDGIEKNILREIAKPYITDEIYKRKKFMFQAPPMKLTHTNKQFQMACDLITSNMGNLLIYNQKELLKFIDEACHMDANDWTKSFNISTTLTSIASIAVLNKEYQIT